MCSTLEENRRKSHASGLRKGLRSERMGLQQYEEDIKDVTTDGIERRSLPYITTAAATTTSVTLRGLTARDGAPP